MAIDFPTAPTLGLEFTAAGIVYVWNGQGWAVKPFAGEAGGPVDSYTKAESHWFFVDVAGDTMTEGLTIASPTASFINLNAPAGAGADFIGTAVNKRRWLLRMGGLPAESGSHAGSDFTLYAYRDDGTTVSGTVMVAKRADLSVSFGGAVKIFSDLRIQRGTGASASDGVIFFGNTDLHHLYYTGGAFRFTDGLYVLNDKAVWHTGNFYPGAYLPIAGGTITGNFGVAGTAYLNTTSVTGTLTASGSLVASGNIQAYGTLYASGGGVNATGISYITGDLHLFAGSGGTGGLNTAGLITAAGGLTTPGGVTAHYFVSAAGGYQGIMYFGYYGSPYYIHHNGTDYILPNAAINVADLFIRSIANRFTADGYIQITTLGLQPGGGYWANSSDSRIKTVTGDYETGLAAIKALNPVRYVYKGNDVFYSGFVTAERAGEASPRGTPDPRSSNHAAAEAGTEYIGLVAQQVKSIMPELVTLAAGEIDGVPVNDLHILNGTALTYALINACKELAARVEALEAAAAQP